MYEPRESMFEAEYEYDGEYDELDEAEFEYEMDDDEVFDEDELTQLAAELMAVETEEELDLFIGGLIKKAGGALRKVAKSSVGRAVKGVLKSAAKKALPLAGGALGAYVGGPLGAKIGSGLARAAGKAMGLEAEMMDEEEMNFEGAKQFVRLGGATVKKALKAPAGSNPRNVAQKAVIRAAKVLAPALVGAKGVGRGRGAASGRWVRRGRNVVLLNA